MANGIAGTKRIGPYQLLAELGRGGMAKVYRARSKGGREVALKVMDRRLRDDADFLRRFYREARVHAGIRHPNVVRCLDFGEDGEHLFIALELLPDGDLARRLAARGGGLPEDEAVALMRDVAAGVAALHAEGVIHRDLKPSNIFLDAVGRAKVADLGLARQAADDEGLTSTGSIVGTPAYLSPEQARADPEIDHRCDIYALGATLYSLLTGHHPYTGSSSWEVVAKILRDPPPDPRAGGAAVSPAVAAIVRRAMARDPRARYPDADAFAAALLTVGIGATQPVPRARRMRVAGIGVAAVALLAGIVAATVTLGGDAEPAVAPPPAPVRSERPAPPQQAADASPEASAVATPVEASASAESAAVEPAPLWAGAAGEDESGRWAEAVIAGRPLRFRYCPAGRFRMGSPADESGRYGNEPIHVVTLSTGFWLAETETTQALYAAVVGANPSAERGDQLPVEQVSWDAVQDFIRQARSSANGAPLRLPTEAEWEYACRAGSDGPLAGDPDRLAWHRGNADRRTHPVGQREANAWGLRDMHGNVWEWCADGYRDIDASDAVDPVGEGLQRVIRGGSYLFPAAQCRSALRDAASPGQHRATLGFRLAIDG